MFADMLFIDRRQAGRRLGGVVRALGLKDPLVLALPRGGVPVGFEVARALKARLDILLVRKLGAPGSPELGIGAVADGHHPQTVLNDETMAEVRPSADYLEEESKRQLAEIERRRKIYLGERPPAELKGRIVVLVDDGIATGGTVKAALKALKQAGVDRIVLAVPVAASNVIDALQGEADEIVCLATPKPFRAVGMHYADFDQISDEEVVRLLEAANATE